jgi:hypothetical protein
MEIKDGPFLWDPDTAINHPDGQHALEESEALNGGYHYYVAPPDPASILSALLSDVVSVNISYLGIDNPSAAAIATQVHELTRAVTALARLQTGMLDSTDGT